MIELAVEALEQAKEFLAMAEKFLEGAGRQD
jgi:hypothetical protein